MLNWTNFILSVAILKMNLLIMQNTSVIRWFIATATIL